MKNGFNATRAYMSVYPDTKEPSARASASELLTNLNITKRITEIQDELAENWGIDIQEVVNSIKKTRASAKSQNDFNASLKADDMLLKIRGGYAVEKKEFITPQFPTQINFQLLEQLDEPNKP
jgi:hypothetical protein